MSNVIGSMDTVSQFLTWTVKVIILCYAIIAITDFRLALEDKFFALLVHHGAVLKLAEVHNVGLCLLLNKKRLKNDFLPCDQSFPLRVQNRTRL